MEPIRRAEVSGGLSARGGRTFDERDALVVLGEFVPALIPLPLYVLVEGGA